MRTKRFLARFGASLAAIFFCAASGIVQAQRSTSATLTGVVSSQEEGPMEGVLVSAKRAGATITVTVVSDAHGRYSFPQDRLEPGQYSLRIRAVGYELDGPKQVEVTTQKTAQADLKLRKAEDLAYQLSNGEWLLSMTGTDQQKQTFLNCVACHSLERIVRSRYSAAEFAQVFQRMATYSQGSTPLRPQKRPGRHSPAGGGGGDMEAAPAPRAGAQERLMKQAEYASTINLSSSSKWSYP